MQRLQLLAVTALLLTAADAAFGQPLIQKVEDQLRGVAGGAALANPASAAGSGYLGGKFDDEPGGARGIRVKEVNPGGPAEAGGLKANDLITAIDNKAVVNLDDLDAVLQKSKAGDKLRITVERAGRPQLLDITLGTRPAPPPAGEAPPPPPPPSTSPSATNPLTIPAAPSPRPSLAFPTAPATPGAPTPAPPDASTTVPSVPASPPGTADSPSSTAAAAGGRPSLGISVLPLTDEARAAYGLPVRRGALIVGVRPGSPADRAGLPIGGVIVTIDGRRVDSDEDLIAAVRAAQPGQELELGYYEGSQLRRKSVRLAPAATATVPSLPPREGPLSLGPPARGDRPLIDRAERMLDNFTPRRGLSTVYDPSEMAALQSSVTELVAQVRKLEERLKAVESKLSITPGTNP